MFDAEKVKNECVQWIRDFFEENGKGCNAVVGISGGKDSSIVAALCVEALGKDRVIGVLMPCGEQHDIDMAKLLVDTLGIKHYIVNIKDAVDGVIKNIPFELQQQSLTNLPARIRMTTLYAVSQSNNGRVANTCNLSEDWVGYSTRYGDAAGDFSPCSHLVVREMKEIGRLLGLPDVLVLDRGEARHARRVRGANEGRSGVHLLRDGRQPRGGRQDAADRDTQGQGHRDTLFHRQHGRIHP